MTTVLHVQSSSNLEKSFSRQVGASLVEALKAKNPATQVIHRDVVKNQLPILPPELFLGQKDLPIFPIIGEIVTELKTADVIVIESPMYNFSIPTALKAWVDLICQAGQTFKYTETGSVGLLENKKAVLVLSRGGIYSEGPAKAMDFQEGYLKAVLGFIGITDVEVVVVEGVAFGEEKAQAAVRSAQEQVAVVVNKLA